MIKNTLICLLTEGIGLNAKWKGNCLKLATKPNLNYLISGIYPWALITNTKKQDKKKFKRKIDAVDKLVDHNFYQILYGDDTIEAYGATIAKMVANQTLDQLALFNHLQQRSQSKANNRVHLFSLLSTSKNKFYYEHLFVVVNILLKKGLQPILHLVADGMDEKVYSFHKTINRAARFFKKRGVEIATIAGRNHVFGKLGYHYFQTEHLQTYFATVCGASQEFFTNPVEYAAENFANQTNDADILPAKNLYFQSAALQPGDALLFLNTDPDDFAGLVHLFANHHQKQDLYLASFTPIYGAKLDHIALVNPVADKQDQLITKLVNDHPNYQGLVLSLNHKKGFVQRFFGTAKLPNISKKIIDTGFYETKAEYFFYANKLLVDKTMAAVGKYDVIFLHMPMVAEAANTGDLSLLKYAIEVFDKNLGRLVNYSKATGNIIAFVSAYGAAEKMLNKKWEIVPYNKNSLVPFVFSNGELFAKKMKASFLNVYASLLSTLNLLEPDNKYARLALISGNFTKNKIQQTLLDVFELWKENVAGKLVSDFEYYNLNLYSTFTKEPAFVAQQAKYVVLKKLLNIHQTVLLTPQARQKLYDVLLAFVNYQKIDFPQFHYETNQTLQTLFNEEIVLQRVSKWANKFFDKRILNTNFVKNNKWFNKAIKAQTTFYEVVAKPKKLQQMVQKLPQSFFPFLYFKTLWYAQLQQLASNDALQIKAFYESQQADLNAVFEKYVNPKIIKVDEDADSENREQDPLVVFQQKQYYAIHTYQDYFAEALEVISTHSNDLVAYNEKFAANKKVLKAKKEWVDYDDIKQLYHLPKYQCNKLTNKLLDVFAFYKRNVFNFWKNEENQTKKAANKYDQNYQLKVGLARNKIVYEGEFEEQINPTVQPQLAAQFFAQANLYKEFDTLSIDQSLAVQTVQNYTVPTAELTPEELATLTDLLAVDQNVRIRNEYNYLPTWGQNRQMDLANSGLIKDNVTLDAENKVLETKGYLEAKQKIYAYHKLSSAWKHKFSEQPVSQALLSEPKEQVTNNS